MSSADVTALITRLGGVSDLAQVQKATTGGNQTLLDTAAQLVTLFGSTFSGRVWPITIPEQNATQPNLVYQRVSSAPITVDGYHVLHRDEFVLTLRDPDYNNLATNRNTIITLMTNSAWALEVTDQIEDFDDARNAYRATLECAFTYLVSDSQALPACFVYPVLREANDNEYDSYTRQLVENHYGLVLVTDDGVTGGEVSTLLAAVEARLLGWNQTSEHQEMRYKRGNALEGASTMHVWREIYFDANHISEA